MLIRERWRIGEEPLLSEEVTSKEVIDDLFNKLESELLDRKEIPLDFSKVSFISVYFLERLERFIEKAKDLKVQVFINNISPSIYKVFQVAKVRSILETCL